MLRRILIAVFLLCLPAFASSKKAPLPDELANARSVYLVNHTGNQEVLDTAYDQFSKWGRFSIAKSKEEADLLVVFNHASGSREGTTVGFTGMQVFVKGNDEAAFQSMERYRSKLFGASSTKSCIADFKKRLEHN